MLALGQKTRRSFSPRRAEAEPPMFVPSTLRLQQREKREKRLGLDFLQPGVVRGRDDFFLSHLATVEGSSIPSTVAPPMGLFARFKMESSGMFLNIDGWAKPPSLLSFTKICLMPLQL